MLGIGEYIGPEQTDIGHPAAIDGRGAVSIPGFIVISNLALPFFDIGSQQADLF
ncbi:hypothetical protein D3C85_1417320 [compost metagenome]